MGLQHLGDLRSGEISIVWINATVIENSLMYYPTFWGMRKWNSLAKNRQQANSVASNAPSFFECDNDSFSALGWFHYGHCLDR